MLIQRFKMSHREIQGREKTFTELNRLDLKDFLAALNVGFHKEHYFIEYCQA